MRPLRCIPALVILSYLWSVGTALADGSCPVSALTWGETGTSSGQFRQAAGIAFGEDGLLYLADQLNQRVQVFRPSREFVRSWEIPPGPRGLAYPTGVCVTNGVVWVTENQGWRVTRWSTDGSFLGDAGAPPFGWQHPNGVGADGSGGVFVCDGTHDRIVHLDALGNYLGHWGIQAAARGIDVDVSNSSLWITTSQDGIVHYGYEGDLLDSWSGFGSGVGSLRGPSGIVRDASGDLYICDSGNDRIVKFTPSGTSLCSVGNNGIYAGQLDAPYGLAQDSQGSIYVSEYLNNRIQVFTYGVVPSIRRTWGGLKIQYR